jgi:hypothetical protein
MKANRNPDKQNLFPIVQGGFDVQLRETSMQQVCAVFFGWLDANAYTTVPCQHPGCIPGLSAAVVNCLHAHLSLLSCTCTPLYLHALFFSHPLAPAAVCVYMRPPSLPRS